MTDLDVPTMNDLFELYRDLSQSLHEEARMACTRPGKADTDIAIRLENQAMELDRLIADYERNRRSFTDRLVA